MKLLFPFVPIIALFATFSVADETSYVCDFERDTCGFTNEENMEGIWIREELELEGRDGYVMTLKTNDTRLEVGRMITPYFEIQEEIPGCFSFDFYITGNGVKSFSVHQERNFGIIPIWVNNKIKQGWQKAQTNVEIDEATRFFFSGAIDLNLGQTILAVDNMVLRLSKC